MPDDKNPGPLVEIINLTEVVHVSGEVRFMTRSLSISLSHRGSQDGVRVLAALSDMAAERAELLHHHLEAALRRRDEK